MIMPRTFLDHLAHELYRQYGEQLHRQLIIIPNLRPAIFLRKALAKVIDKPIAAPTILSIEEFVFQCVNLHKCSSTESLLRLYNSVQTHASKSFTIDEFLGLGPMLLTDIYEIDLYLADPADLFNYLSDIKKIEQWAPDAPDAAKGTYARKYLAFYETLGAVYTDYRNKLLKDHMADPALAFRTFAENAPVYLHEFFTSHPEANLIFAGFNALSPAESNIMRSAKRMNKAQFFWDADAWYVKQKQQEAGLFFRDMHSDLLSDKDKNNMPANIGQHPLKVTCVETTGNVQQVLYAAEKVAQWEEAKTYANEQVAIVLSDETLVNDLVQLLPAKANVNLTLGIGLDNLQAGQLIYNLTRLYKNKGSLYYKDLLRVLRHPFMVEWFAGKGHLAGVQSLTDQMSRGNLIYIKPALLQEYLSPEIADLLSPKDAPLTALTHTEKLLESIAAYWDQSRERHENYEREQTYAALHVVRDLKHWVENYLNDIDLGTLADVCWQLCKNETISFRGEPETGIQIMGILETRLLHLDQMVILSVNEDVIPRSKHKPTLIPNDVRRQFNLTLHTHNDAIFAYHFYHLFHGAHTADLVYTQGGSGMGNAGPSRFIYQIEWEWIKAFPQNVQLKKNLYYAPLSQEDTWEPLSISKSKQVVDALEKKLATDGISPSAINKYLRDPIQFYREYLLGIREEDSDPSEDVDMPALGQAVHAVLEEVFTPFINQTFPDKETLKSLKKKAKGKLEAALQKELGGASLKSGKNLLALTAANEMIDLAFTFENDIPVDKRKILALENKRADNMEGGKICVNLPIETKYGPVKLCGVIDRLELWDDNTSVYLDYKTGSTGQGKFISWPENPEDIVHEKRLEKLGYGIQLLCYALLDGKQNTPFRAALIGLKKQSDGYKWLMKDPTQPAELRTQFSQYLCGLIEEIMYEGTFGDIE